MNNPNQAIIDSGWKFVLSVSGGGQEVIGDLTKHGGMSNTLLEAVVPYSLPAYHSLIHGVPDRIVSPAAARAAAMACYKLALKYAPDHNKVFGVASTGAVVKVGGEREGRKHRVCMAIQDSERTVSIDMSYHSGRSRQEEESLTAKCIREAIKWGCHTFGDIEKQLTGDDFINVASYIAPKPMQDLIHGRIYKSPNHESKAIFSSSCNPLHNGHLNIIRDASARLGRKIDIELCVQNADKPPLDYRTIYERLVSIGGVLANVPEAGEVILTNHPLFFDKVKLFPGATFIVGMDTFDRILDSKYYIRGEDAVLFGLVDMQEADNQLLVYPRKGYTPEHRNYHSVEGKIIRKVARFVSPFNGYEVSDLSSTAIRKAEYANS